MFQIERKYPIELILFFSVIIFSVSAQEPKLISNKTANGELGKTAVVSCLLSQENVTVTWNFKGKTVKFNERIKQDNQTISLKKNDKDGNEIKNKNFTLTIRNTTLEDVGDYVCIAGNQSDIVYLNLSFPAKFIKKSPPVEVVFPREGIPKPREGRKGPEVVSLSCIFEVYNTTFVRWSKKDEDLTDKAITNPVPNNPKQIESIYNFTVSNADTESGTYKCEIVDPILQKKIASEINVTIFDKPTIAIDKVIPISPTELFVKWNVSTHSAPVQNYTLSTIGKGNIGTYYNKVINPNNTSVIVDNLLKSTQYKVKVSVTTEYGSATNESEIVSTLDSEPNLVPNISIKGFSATSVTIGWEAPSEDVGKLIHYYVLDARKKNENDTKKAYHPKDQKNLPYMFDDLEPHSTYIFKVCAGSEYFTKTSCSNEMEAATLDGIPGQPSDFHAYCGPRYMNLTWGPPLKPNAEIKGYTMELSGTSLPYKDRFGNIKVDEWGPLAKFKTNDSKEARFEDLQANTNYTVRLSALTRTRKRGEEVVRNCTTDAAPPDSPPRPYWRKVSDNSKYMFKLYMPRVSERNGPICCYRIYMIRLPHHFDWNSMPLPKDIKVLRYNDTLLQSGLAAYITDVFSNDEFPDETKLIMGDGYSFRNFSENKNCSRCRRMPLYETLQQNVEITTILPEEDAKREMDPEIYPEDGSLDTSHNYTLFVELIPASEKYEPMYSEYLNVLMPAPPDVPVRPLNKMEIALQVTCAIAAAVLLGMLIFCIMQTRKSRKMQQAHMELNPIEKFVRIIRGLGGQQPLVSTTPPDLPPIAKEDLAAAYAQRQADSDYEFQKEFELLQLLPDCFPDRTTHASEARENQSKNRYPDIKAYDQTRVKLCQIDSITGSDYINANYVVGYQERKQFICAQGPTDTTVNDFWRMIWEHGLELIVMLTNLEEYSKVKCSKYWPDEVRGSRAFGNITVHHVSEKRYSDYIVRELKITKHPTTVDGQPIVENNGIAKRNGDCKDSEEGSVPSSPREFKEAEMRTVRQYHFLVWKDFAAPEHPHSILKFIKRVNEASASLMGRPVVVHCSAGVGRTGTLVALDCLLDQLRDTGHAAVFNTVAELRRQRNFLVQSLKQYVFVYRALVEYAHYGDTEIPASRLKTSIDRLRNTPEDADKCLMEHEFEKMINSPVSETVKSSSAGASEEVRSRNRSMDCLPYDRNRVILTPIPTREFSTYINASFIEAYDNSEGFIITQDPLPSTIMDFWRMVSEHNVSTIVMLSEMGESKCPRYWDDGTAQYEHISVQYEESESCPYYTRRQFRVSNTKNGEVTSVLQLQYQGWPTAPGHVPEVTRGLAELADAAQPPAPPPHALSRPMLVHCQYGTERSSLFVALCILIRQLRVERRVDVNSVARKVRSQRAHTIDTFLQYEFLHRAILNYAELHNLLEDS